MPTIKEIAVECGVSIATVSKAINRLPGISKETAERVRETAKQMGYLPNIAARTLKTNRTNNIGVLFANIDNSFGLQHEFFARILDNIKSEAEENGYDITFINSKIDGHDETYLDHCRYRNYDGVIIVTVDFFDPQVIELAMSKIPVVTIDYVFEGCGSVVSDNGRGMANIVKYVYDMGHRKIAYIHGTYSSVTRYRIGSFISSCTEFGINIPDEYVREGKYRDTETSAELTKELLDLDNSPTCILYPDDISLIGGMQEIEKRGLNIPEDISIVGYDGILISELYHPKFTTLRQNAEAIGQEAAVLLMQEIESPETFIPKRIVIPGKLRVGETVKRLDVIEENDSNKYNKSVKKNPTHIDRLG